MTGSRTFRVEREDGPDAVIRADEFRRHSGGRSEYVEFCDNETKTGTQGEYTRHIPVATVRDPLLVEEVPEDVDGGPAHAECVRKAAEQVVAERNPEYTTIGDVTQVTQATGCERGTAEIAISDAIQRRKAAERAVAKHGTGILAANRVILDTGCNYPEAKAAVDAEVARRCTHGPKKVVATITLDGGRRPGVRAFNVNKLLLDALDESSYSAEVESVVVEVS